MLRAEFWTSTSETLAFQEKASASRTIRLIRNKSGLLDRKSKYLKESFCFTPVDPAVLPQFSYKDWVTEFDDEENC